MRRNGFRPHYIGNGARCYCSNPGNHPLPPLADPHVKPSPNPFDRIRKRPASRPAPVLVSSLPWHNDRPLGDYFADLVPRADPDLDLSVTKVWYWTLKLAPCTDCGQTFHPVAMHFDHLFSNKVFNISKWKGKTRRELLAEIAKCELVCAVCHALRTYQRQADDPWSKQSGIDYFD
jgi:hypothetical protein